MGFNQRRPSRRLSPQINERSETLKYGFAMLVARTPVFLRYPYNFAEMCMIRNMIAAAVLLLLFGAAPSAFADSATWTFTDVTLSDRATVTGSFVYDATTNTVTSIDISTSAGSSSAGATYTSLDPGYGPFAFDMAFVTQPSLSDYTGTPALEFQTLGDVSLTNLGGVIPVDVNEFLCTDTVCDTADEIRGSLDGGTLVGVVNALEPSVAPLLAIGLLAVIAVSKRRVFRPKLNNR
jgi:hypothetical protein